MRFHLPKAAVLAASITISGCTTFSGDVGESTGSFRQAPASELLVRAEQFERDGDYAHAAKMYEEILRNDPGRAQVRRRLQALAAYGIVSPHAHGALTSNVQSLVAQHQGQLSPQPASASVQQRVAEMQPTPLPEEFSHLEITWYDETPSETAGPAVARVTSPPVSHTVSVPATEPAAEIVALTEPNLELASQLPQPAETPIPAPTVADASEIAPGPASWEHTVIRSQEDTRRSFDSEPDGSDAVATESTASRHPIAGVVSAGSNLWRHTTTSEPFVDATAESALNSPAHVDSIAVTQDDSHFDWADTPHVDGSESTHAATDWWEPAKTAVASIDVQPDARAAASDEFLDPIVAAPQELPTSEYHPEVDSISPIQRAHSAYTLWQVSGSSTQAVPSLVELLEHQDSHVVEVACYFLGEFGPQAAAASESLQYVRDTADESTAILAAEALAKIDPSQTDSVERIVAATQSSDPQCRLLAAITLASIDAAHEQTVVPALAGLLDDDEAEVRSAAALSLGGWGQAASPCTTKLEELALGDLPEVAEAARIALQCIEQ